MPMKYKYPETYGEEGKTLNHIGGGNGVPDWTGEETLRKDFMEKFACDCDRKCGEFKPDENCPESVVNWWIEKIRKIKNDYY